MTKSKSPPARPPRPPSARLPLPKKRGKPHGQRPKAYDRKKEKERLRKELES